MFLVAVAGVRCFGNVRAVNTLVVISSVNALQCIGGDIQCGHIAMHYIGGDIQCEHIAMHWR